MLVDIADCIGCKSCEVACKEWNENPAERTHFTGSYQSHPGTTPQTWTVVTFTEDEAGHPDRSGLFWHFTKVNCMHCTEAACVQACPTDALYHTEMGAVNLEPARCIGCGKCEAVCPFDQVHVATRFLDTSQKAGKCTLCYDRISAGMAPACVKACPTDAIKYGTRSDLIAWGKQRVEELRARGYDQANLYGESELGGLHQLYVLLDRPSRYGLPEDPKVPTSLGVWRQFVNPFGKVALAATVLGLVSNFFVTRWTLKGHRAHARRE